MLPSSWGGPIAMGLITWFLLSVKEDYDAPVVIAFGLAAYAIGYIDGRIRGDVDTPDP